jgi:hypothetical protein
MTRGQPGKAPVWKCSGDEYFVRQEWSSAVQIGTRVFPHISTQYSLPDYIYPYSRGLPYIPFLLFQAGSG